MLWEWYQACGYPEHYIGRDLKVRVIFPQFVLVHRHKRIFFLVRIEEFDYSATDKILPI